MRRNGICSSGRRGVGVRSSAIRGQVQEDEPFSLGIADDRQIPEYDDRVRPVRGFAEIPRAVEAARAFVECDQLSIVSVAVRALRPHDIGVLVAPRGVGKTVAGIRMIAERGRNTLVLVHLRPLLEQWVAQLAMFLDVDPRSIGRRERLGQLHDRLLKLDPGDASGEHDLIEFRSPESLGQRE